MKIQQSSKQIPEPGGVRLKMGERKAVGGCGVVVKGSATEKEEKKEPEGFLRIFHKDYKHVCQVLR